MAVIIALNGNDLTIQVTLKLSGSLLEMENTILDGCNEIGCLATTEAIDDCLNKVKSTYNDQVRTLLNPKFQLFTKSASMPA